MIRRKPITPKRANRIFLICLTLAAILVTAIANAQDLRFNDKEYFTASMILDPNASIKESGLFIGGEIEYVGLIYTRIGIANFAVLEDGYTEAIGAIGLNLTSGYFDKVRYYAGGRLGVIKRQATNATAGVECGFDFLLGETAFVGLRAVYDYRSDQDFYDYPNEMRYSGFIRLGFKF
jgi:hypothetical protein